jgi:hypothetical protein
MKTAAKRGGLLLSMGMEAGFAAVLPALCLRDISPDWRFRLDKMHITVSRNKIRIP